MGIEGQNLAISSPITPAAGCIVLSLHLDCPLLNTRFPSSSVLEERDGLARCASLNI